VSGTGPGPELAGVSPWVEFEWNDISNMYLIRLINVSGLCSNYIPMIYQPARIWWFGI
jgi:hypothetical protein